MQTCAEISDLTAYLSTCKNNKDRFVFFDKNGKLDMDAARKFAESIRIKNPDIKVFQRSNIVELSLYDMTLNGVSLK